jgi:hypothetical protein
MLHCGRKLLLNRVLLTDLEEGLHFCLMKSNYKLNSRNYPKPNLNFPKIQTKSPNHKPHPKSRSSLKQKHHNPQLHNVSRNTKNYNRANYHNPKHKLNPKLNHNTHSSLSNNDHFALIPSPSFQEK